MASHQVTGEKKKEEGVVVEKDRVPKITSHFESLTVSPVKESGVINVGKFEMHGEEAKDLSKESRRTSEIGDANISQYRQAASNDALRAAGERYKKTKKVSSGVEAKDNLNQGAEKTSKYAAEKGRDTLNQGAEKTTAEKGARAKESVMQGALNTCQIAAEKGAQAKDSLMQGAQIAAEKGAQAKESLMQGAQRTSQYAAEKGGILKHTVLEKGKPLYETTRDTLGGEGKTAADYTGQVKEYVAEKDVVAETGKGTVGYVGQAKDFVAEKAVGAKDVVVVSGKGTVGYVGSVATTVKDKAVVAGWGAAEYTAEKVVGATKAVANVTAGAAGYVGETAVAAKDKVGSVGVSAKDYAAQKLAAAKDTIVATEESAKDYAARKRAEAEREMQAKKSAEGKVNNDTCVQGEVWSSPTEQKHDDIAGAGRQTVEAAKETIKKPVEKAGEFFQEQSEYGSEGQGGVFNAIGETIVEIGQTTKDLLVGKGETQATESMKESSK